MHSLVRFTEPHWRPANLARCKMPRMGNATFKLLRVAFTVAGLASVMSGQQSSPDLILFNGKIFTSNSSQPHVEALAIRGERITAAGNSKEIIALARPNTMQIDLGGRTVIPGINDAHLHLSVGPETFDLETKTGDPTWQELKDALAAAAAKAPKGRWIDGSFGPTILDDPQATRVALDALSPDDPVILFDWSGHASLLNTLALRKLGIQEDEPNPEGGMYVRNPANGQLTGMVFEFAEFRVVRHFTELVTEQEALQQLGEFFTRAERLGITTIQQMGNPLAADRSVSLFEKSPPPIRVRVIWFGLTDQHGRMTEEGRNTPAHPVPLVTVSGTKWILDGTPIEHSAAMRRPYADRPSTAGELDFSLQEMEAMLRESLRRHDQLMVHVMGDRTTETFLNAMVATGGEKVWSKRRVRLEHGDGLVPDLIARAKKLGVIVVHSPTHFNLDLYVKRFGEVGQQMMPLRSLSDSGIPVALGSDGPLNPYLNIMLASTFPGKAKEALTREQAVIAYTFTSAYAEFAEKDKGSLETGKLADLAVLSQDIFSVAADDLPKTESVLTVVNGKIVYDANVLSKH